MKRHPQTSSGAANCRRKFLRAFPKGFRDETYLAWERDYQWKAHQQWEESLNRDAFAALLGKKRFAEIAAPASLLEFADTIRHDLRDMRPSDMIAPAKG